jgi:hypothetical protein
MDSRVMTGQIHSFPYNKHIWVLSINQLADPNTEKVFSDEFSNCFDPAEYNFNSVTDLVMGTGVNELNTVGDHTSYLQQTIHNCEKLFPNLKNIYLFYTNVYFQENLLNANANITCIHLPYFLMRSALPNETQFTDWDVGNKRAICLIGDIRNRVHKFPLIYYFYKNGSLSKLDYSLLNNHYGDDYFCGNSQNLVIKILNYGFNETYDIKSFEQLYDKLRKTFDNDDGFINPAAQTGLSRYTHNFPPAWHDATVNILLESKFYPLKEHVGRLVNNGQPEFFFSEKVWKPLMSGKPFISLSAYDLIDTQLESMGFRTFTKYTNISDKATIPKHGDFIDFTKSLHKYLEICYSRTLSFIDNCELYRQEIKEDVVHNIKLWEKLSYESWEELYTKCPVARKMTKEEFCEIFNHVPSFNMFGNWFEKG